MANTGDAVTVWEGKNGINWTGYREPPQVCFEKAKNLPTINQEEVDKTKPLLTRETDVNGDGIADEFRIVETKDYFLALLYRGANYEHVWESSCGGGASGDEKSYTAPEPKGQLVGAIAKDSKLQRKITKVDWQVTSLNEKSLNRFVVSGVEVYNNKPKEVKWDFAYSDCPPPAKEKEYREAFGGCI